jgi:cobalt-zinc-cadmium efflux system membrane fusion protein
MRRRLLIPLLALAALAGVAGLAALGGGGRYARLLAARLGPKAPAGPAAAAPTPATTPDAPWDGTVAVSGDQAAALGLAFEPARPQTEPTYLDVTGTTAYDPATLTKVRSRFNCLVNKVYVSIGSVVKKGEPLLDLFSTDLAEAKSLFEERQAQWRHDKAQLDRIRPLFEQKAISEREFFDAQNDEQKSRLQYKVAHDDLVVFGLDEPQIANLEHEEGSHKAMLTLKSPADGQVLARDAVEGSLYDPTTVLLMIAPTDRLWVLGNVYESDQNRVAVGQTWEIRFPFLPNVIEARVEHIDSRIDPTSRTVPIRCTIGNPGGRFKADMLVQTRVAIPPAAGRTVVPRVAVVFQDADPYVFVRNEGAAAGACRLERRKVELAQESHDQVILARGVMAEEEVVGRGALLCAQMYEDRYLAERGTSP